MIKINVPAIEKVSAESKAMLEIVGKRMGKIPNLYATIGYSSHALKSFIDFDASISKGVFTPKQREAVALVVSQYNGCAYCLAGHTMMALRAGFSTAETIDIRKGSSPDEKINVIIKLAKSIAETKGHAEPTYVEEFFNAGFNEAALIELVGLIALRVFTNYVFAITEIPVDFPAAPPLQ